MTPQEQAMLNDLIQRVEQTQLTEKDPEAEQLLNQRLGQNPYALYILAQTVLVQKYALDQATARLNQTRQPQPQPAHTNSFLGNLLGRFEPAPPPPPPPPGYGAQPMGQPWNAVPSYGGGAPSFLRSAATTAAGVAAGALAFEGVESLLHGFGHESGFGGRGAPEEFITNNYYDDGQRETGHREQFEHSGLSGSDGDATNLQQASDDLRGSDAQNDLSLDDTSYDDSSSFDDSSSGNDDLA